MFKKCCHLFIMIILCLLLPFMFYITKAGSLEMVPAAVDGDGFVNTGSQEETINFYALIYGPDKCSVSMPESKSEPEPEPAPPSQTGSGSAETGPEQQVPEQSSSQSASSGSPSGLNQKEQQMLNYINEARKSAGLSPLRVCSQLTAAARAKSRDMVDKNYFSHTSPTYGGLGGLLSHFSISYRSAGENLAMNSNGSVSAAHNSLMGSPGHRDNILGRNYSDVGIGIHIKSDGSHYYTQLFVGR